MKESVPIKKCMWRLELPVAVKKFGLRAKLVFRGALVLRSFATAVQWYVGDIN